MSDREKTRLKAKAVQRRAPDVSNLPTRPALRAVKRAPKRPELEDLLAPVDKVSVLRRGGLRNAAGKTDDGWLVRETGGEDLFHYIQAAEPMLQAIARGLGNEADIYFDVMHRKASLACVVLHGKATYSRGSAELLNAEAEDVASLHLGKKLWAECVLGANPEALLTVHPDSRGTAQANARHRMVARINPSLVEGLFPRLDGYDVSFYNQASPFERLLTVTSVALADAFEIRARYREGKRRNL